VLACGTFIKEDDMGLRLISFGFRYGAPIGTVVDVRSVTNPHHDRALRKLTGLDGPVQYEIMASPHFERIVRAVKDALLDSDEVYVGCTGGRHRSVAVAVLVAGMYPAVAVHHRDLQRNLDEEQARKDWNRRTPSMDPVP
jgi:UPF0042 nucleotide-binding protein